MQKMPERLHPAKPLRVAVCVATFQRPRFLQTLLDAFSQLRFSKLSKPALEIIVVDNDEAQSAKPVCNLIDYPWSVRYVCEPQRGIARARNRAIDCAAGADFLAFIDDDEVPAPHWLDELLWAQSQFQADVVSGSVIPLFSDNVPDWIRKGRFFHRPVFETGYRVQLCSTNNALIRSKILDVVSSFDEQFNFSGGEDTHFFLRVREAGSRMIFSREAVVYEPISTERANFSWLLRRGFQTGNSWARCESSLHAGSGTAILRVFKELIHISHGTSQFLVALFLGKAQFVRSLQTISAGLGTLAGVAGYRFMPYADVRKHETILGHPPETRPNAF